MHDHVMRGVVAGEKASGSHDDDLSSLEGNVFHSLVREKRRRATIVLAFFHFDMKSSASTPCHISRQSPRIASR